MDRWLVALRKESVDRNLNCSLNGFAILWSLSARRAWIEIPPRTRSGQTFWVALRKESVDRNLCLVIDHQRDAVSLSARRAWIEIRAWTP